MTDITKRDLINVAGTAGNMLIFLDDRRNWLWALALRDKGHEDVEVGEFTYRSDMVPDTPLPEQYRELLEDLEYEAFTGNELIPYLVEMRGWTCNKC